MQNRYSDQNYQGGQHMSSASCFLLGIAVGSAAALLFTPVSGRRLRGLVGERVEEGRRAVSVRARESWNKAAGVASDVAKEATAKMEAGKRYFDDERRKVEGAIQAGKRAYRDVAGVGDEADGAVL
jgi:gas vesicle protein